MAVTPDSITSRFPALASASPESLTAAIQDAELEINRDAFGPTADLATVYLAAHLWAQRNPGAAGAGGASGALQSITVGPITKTYAVPSAGSSTGAGAPAAYASTPYGLMFWSLALKVPTGLLVI